MMQDRAESGQLLEAHITDLDGRAKILRLAGEVDISSAQVLTDHLALIARDKPSAVVIDTTEITFMDSSGLHALVEGKKLIHKGGTRIVLVPSRHVRRVLELVFPDQLFATRVDTVDEALAALEEDSSVTPEK